MACLLNEVGVGVYTSPGGKLQLSLKDTVGNISFVPSHCKAWNITTVTTPVAITAAPEAPVTTPNAFALHLTPAAAGQTGILYQIQLAFAPVPITSQAQLIEAGCGQVLSQIDVGKLSQQLLVQVVG